MLSITDEREISAVLIRYATGIDRRDWTLFQSCFTDDARTEYGAFGQWNSAAQISAFMQEAHAGMGHTLHRLSNFVIAAQGDGAVARSYVDALLTPGAAGGDVHRGVGFYDDELIKTERGWRIKFRRFTAVQIL
jgi:3-phenylpropionate/cinnamic acid dioxygenase small subunit